MAAEQEEELDNLRRQLKDLQEEAQEGKGLRAALRKKDGEVRANQCGVGEGERSVSHHCSSFHCPPCPALPAVSWQVEALRDALQELERELEEAKRDMTELVDDRQSVSGQGAGQEDPFSSRMGPQGYKVAPCSVSVLLFVCCGPRSQVQDQYSQDLNDALAENEALKDQVQGLEGKLEVGAGG